MFAFCRYIITIGPEQDKIRIIAFDQVKLVGKLVEYLVLGYLFVKAVLVTNFYELLIQAGVAVALRNLLELLRKTFLCDHKRKTSSNSGMVFR